MKKEIWQKKTTNHSCRNGKGSFGESFAFSIKRDLFIK